MSSEGLCKNGRGKCIRLPKQNPGLMLWLYYDAIYHLTLYSRINPCWKKLLIKISAPYIYFCMLYNLDCVVLCDDVERVEGERMEQDMNSEFASTQYSLLEHLLFLSFDVLVFDFTITKICWHTLKCNFPPFISFLDYDTICFLWQCVQSNCNF